MALFDDDDDDGEDNRVYYSDYLSGYFNIYASYAYGLYVDGWLKIVQTFIYGGPFQQSH